MATIDLTITFNTPFHIGGDDSRFRVARDSRGRTVIFASTLRGIHRASVEGIVAALGLYTCNPPVPEQMCQPLVGQRVCPVCRIFGSAWVSGRIYYADLTTTAAPQVETRTRASRHRVRRTRAEVYTEQREMLPAGTIFSGQIKHLLSDRESLALAVAGLRSLQTIGGGLCQIEARALDDSRKPVQDRDLAAVLEQLRRSRS